MKIPQGCDPRIPIHPGKSFWNVGFRNPLPSVIARIGRDQMQPFLVVYFSRLVMGDDLEATFGILKERADPNRICR